MEPFLFPEQRSRHDRCLCPIPLIGLSGVGRAALGAEDFSVEWVGVSVGASHVGARLTGSSCGCQTGHAGGKIQAIYSGVSHIRRDNAIFCK